MTTDKRRKVIVPIEGECVVKEKKESSYRMLSPELFVYFRTCKESSQNRNSAFEKYGVSI